MRRYYVLENVFGGEGTEYSILEIADNTGVMTPVALILPPTESSLPYRQPVAATRTSNRRVAQNIANILNRGVEAFLEDERTGTVTEAARIDVP